MSWMLFNGWVALTCVIILTRVGPLACAKWLRRQKWIEPVSKQLPCMVLTLLLIYDLIPKLHQQDTAIASAVGLAATWCCFRLRFHIMVVITVAVFVYNYMLNLLA